MTNGIRYDSKIKGLVNYNLTKYRSLGDRRSNLAFWLKLNQFMIESNQKIQTLSRSPDKQLGVENDQLGPNFFQKSKRPIFWANLPPDTLG